MRASRLAHPIVSYWASNVVSGVGLGTQSIVYNVALGVGGVLWEPYNGIRQRGIYGGCVGIVRGIGGLVRRPLKGGFEFFAQPVAGLCNTPGFIYKKLTHKKDPTSMKITNFKIFGIDEIHNERNQL